MERYKPIIFLFVGMLLGVLLMHCTQTFAKDDFRGSNIYFESLKLITYPSGATGIFDPGTGKLYLYDSKLESCFMVRKLRKLGADMIEIYSR